MTAGRALLLAGVVAAASCAPSSGDSPMDAATPGGEAGSASVSFDREIKPLFATRCNDCHTAGSASGYDFTHPFDPQTGIVNRPNSWVPNGSKPTKVVDPGNVANSFLILKVTEPILDDHVDGNPMPYQLPRLNPTELDAVRRWITDGANNDAFFASNVAPIFGTAVKLGAAGGRCTYCHYPNAPSGMNVLDVFNPTQGMVNRTSTKWGGKMVAPGDPDNSVLIKKLSGGTAGPQMPMHYERLTSVEIQRLRNWIMEGARDN